MTVWTFSTLIRILVIELTRTNWHGLPSSGYFLPVWTQLKVFHWLIYIAVEGVIQTPMLPQVENLKRLHFYLTATFVWLCCIFTRCIPSLHWIACTQIYWPSAKSDFRVTRTEYLSPLGSDIGDGYCTNRGLIHRKQCNQIWQTLSLAMTHSCYYYCD